ncbi:hypothetical protein I6E41_07955 [Prevotella stercorea]|nr:DUF6048 family protein [Leyella stercorea]MCF2614844.1 hypothetical protein [Leyella stercorea]
MTVKRTSSFVSRVITISLLLIAVTTATAQSRKDATADKKLTAQKDTVAFFRGVAVSADVVGLAQLAFSDYGQYEAALRINLKDRYFPVFELGYGTADSDNPTTNLKYKTSAPYWRVGMDFNIAKNKHDAYRVYAGARYAMTYYKFDVVGSGLKDPVWGDDVDYNVKGMKAYYHWMEAVFGVDAKIAGPLRLGWSVRYRRRITHDDGNIGKTWYVPGYGKQGGSRLGGTFNIIFEI